MKKLLIILAMTLACSGAFGVDNWYVAQSGDDSANTCTSAGSPCATVMGVFAKGGWDANATGGVVITVDTSTDITNRVTDWTDFATIGYFLPNVYIANQDCANGCTLRSAGDVDTKWVPTATFKNEAYEWTDSPPAAYANTSLSVGLGVMLYDSDNWTIEGLHFDSNGAALRIVNSSNYEIKNNIFTCDWGASNTSASGDGDACASIIGSDYGLVEGNKIHRDGNSCNTGWIKRCASTNQRSSHMFGLCEEDADCFPLVTAGVDEQFPCAPVQPPSGFIVSDSNYISIRSNIITAFANLGGLIDGSTHITFEKNIIGQGGEHGFTTDDGVDLIVIRNNNYTGDPDCMCSGDPANIAEGECGEHGTSFESPASSETYYSETAGPVGRCAIATSTVCNDDTDCSGGGDSCSFYTLSDLTWIDCNVTTSAVTEAWIVGKQYCSKTYERYDSPGDGCTGVGAGSTVITPAWQNCARQPRNMELYELSNSVIQNNILAGHVHPTKEISSLAYGLYFEAQCSNYVGASTITTGSVFENLLIYNNLFYDYGYAQDTNTAFVNSYIGYVTCAESGGLDAVIENDVLFDYNLYHEGTGDATWRNPYEPVGEDAFPNTLAGWRTMTTNSWSLNMANTDANSKYLEPSFTSYSTLDYSATSSSAEQVDAGTTATDSTTISCPLGTDAECPGWNYETATSEFTCNGSNKCVIPLCAPSDYLGNERPNGDGCDIGNYEWYASQQERTNRGLTNSQGLKRE